jgi:hypothetical protein
MYHQDRWACVPLDWPATIKISGLPLFLCGWNTVFTITDQTSNGLPVYHMRGYTLYWFFRILSARILNVKGQWFLQRDCDEDGTYILHKSVGCQLSPIGFWSHDAIVTEEAWT